MGLFRQLVFDVEDVGEILVDIWPDGPATLAVRSAPGDVWGPPIIAKKDTAQERIR